ncbi:MAG: ABC transporter substrate-binding protein [Pseudomonadota bacterium]
MGASLQIVQQLAAGNIQFGQINASIVVQSDVMNGLSVRTVMENGVVDWAVVALEDGPIKTMADLKGKTIGVYSLASGGVPFLRAYLRANGIDPEKDVQMIAVGAGAPGARLAADRQDVGAAVLGLGDRRIRECRRQAAEIL